MFDTLDVQVIPGVKADQIACISTERLEAEICQLSADLTASLCRWLLMVAEFDRREAWGAWGIRSCAHWLSWRCSIALGTARDHLRVARRLAELPVIRAEFASGTLSYAKVRALVRIATPATEAGLVGLALIATAPQLERMVRTYRKVEEAADADAAGGAARAARCYLRVRYDDNGDLMGSFRLSPDDGALLLDAVDAVVSDDERRAALEEEGRGGASCGRIAPQPGELSRARGLVRLAQAALEDPAGDEEAADADDEEAADPGHEHDAPGFDDLDEEETLDLEDDADDGLDLDDEGAWYEGAGAAEDYFDDWPADVDADVEAQATTAEGPGPEPGHRPRLSRPRRGRVTPRKERPSFARPAHLVIHAEVAAVLGAAAGVEDYREPLPGMPGTGPGGTRLPWLRAHLASGPGLGPATLGRLCCDASVEVLVLDGEGNPLHLGRRRRLATERQRRALLARDGGCTFPGCTRVRYLHAHHICPWEAGGPTCIDNLTLLCTAHHHAVHEGGFGVSGPARGLRFTRPDGVPIEAVPAPCPSSSPVAERNRSLGVVTTPDTPTSSGNGEGYDLDLTMQVMWEMFHPPAGVGPPQNVSVETPFEADVAV